MKEQAVFTTRYHVSVNKTLIDDLSAIGLKVYLPDDNFGRERRIDFFDSNSPHVGVPNVQIIDYAGLRALDPKEVNLAFIIPCVQLYGDFMRLVAERDNVDEIVYLTANSTSLNTFELDKSNYIMSHDLYFHRAAADKGKYRMWYWSKPTLLVRPRTREQMRRAWEEKQINLYIHNFFTDGFDLERPKAQDLAKRWEEKTGRRIPFYGYGSPNDPNLDMRTVQEKMVESMFTLVFKRRETVGQMVNESMLLGTPCIFLREFLYSTFTEYEINQDNSILCDSVDEIMEKISNISWEDYETLCMEAQTTAERFMNDDVRRKQLRWFFDRVYSSPKFQPAEPQ